MIVRKLADGSYEIPLTAESEDGDLLGDSTEVVAPQTSKWLEWDEWLQDHPEALKEGI